MAADYSAYDAGTAYLTIEAQLDKDFEGKLAADLAAIKPLPINLTPDLDNFVKDLDKQWDKLGHSLKIKVDPVTSDQIAGEGLEPLKVIADLNTDAANAKLREFFSLVPVYEIPAMLNTKVAESQLEELRAKAAEPIVIPVSVQQQPGGVPPLPRQMANDATAQRQSAEQVLFAAARENPQLAAQEVVGAAAAANPAAAQRMLAGAAAQGATGTPATNPTPAGTPSPQSPSTRDLDTLQKDLVRALTKSLEEAERRLPLTTDGEKTRQGLRSSAKGIRSIISDRIPDDPADAANMRSASREAVQGFAASVKKDLGKFGISDEPSSLASLTSWFDAIKSGGLGGAFKGLPLLGGKSGWTSMLSSSGMMSEEGAGAAAAGLGAVAAVAPVVVSAFTSLASKVIDAAEQIAKLGMIGGALGLGGGLLADLSALGLTGAFGLHNVPAALSAGEALHEWKIDPNAQAAYQSSVISASQGQVAAGQGVEHSQWAYADAVFGAKMAQEQLTVAQESAALAQRSLNDAYREAGRQVRDMNTALEDAKLNQMGAALSVAEAKSALLETMLDPESTPIQRQRAAWQVDYAKQRYAESKNKTADAAVDASIANQRGIDQSTAVLDATRAMQTASMGVEEAVHNQIDAQHQITIATEQIAAAIVQVQLAALAMQQALNPAPLDQYNIALSKLSPNARDFVQTIEDLAPEVRDLQRAVEDQLFSGLGDALKKFVSEQGIAISGALTGIANALNTGIKDTLTGLSTMFTQMQRDGTWDKFVKGVEDFAKGVSPVLTGVVSLFMQLGAHTADVVGPLMQQLGTSLTSIGPHLGDLAASFGKALVDVLPDLTRMFNALAKTFSDSGAMDAMSSMFSEIAHIITEIAPDIGPIVKALADDFTAFMKGVEKSGGLKTLADDFLQWSKDLQPLMEPLGALVAWLLPKIIEYGPGLILTVLHAAEHFRDLWDRARPAVELFGTLLENVPLVAGVLGDIVSPISTVAGAFKELHTWVDRLVGRLEDFIRKLTGIRQGTLPDKILGGIVSALSLGMFHASGGPISGPGTGTSDSIPAMLSDGEYVINARAAAQHGPLLDAINYGAPGFALGGIAKAGTGVLLARDVTSGKYAKAVRKIAEKSIPGFATGGPVNAKQWGMDHPNIPYVWGQADVYGADCSGYVGLLQQVATGVANPAGRLGQTDDVVDGRWPFFVKSASADDAFIIGANKTHMAASILGTNFESRQAGEDVRIGSNAVSPFNSQFTVVGHVDPKQFQPQYKPDASPSDEKTDLTSTNANSEAVSKETNLSGYKPTTWSGWAGDNTTKAIQSLAYYGTLFPPTTGEAPAGPMNALQSAMEQAVTNAPADQQDWWSQFLLGKKVDRGQSDGTSASTGEGADGSGTGNSPDKLGTDKTANQLASGGAMGAIQKLVGNLSKAAGKFVSGQVSSALNVLGGSELDNVPGWVQGGYQLYTLLNAQQSTQQASPGTGGNTGDGNQPTKQAQPSGTAGGTKGSADGSRSNNSTTTGGNSTPGGTTTTGGGGNTTGGTTTSGVDAYASSFGASPSLIADVQGAAQLFGWGSGAEWNSLDQLIGHESSWNPNASAEPLSDAYGLYQFLSTTWATVGGAKTSDPKAQAIYGNKYIAQKYGDPINAWSFWQAQSPHWYAAGGDVVGDGPGFKDTVPAMLANGEFVVNAASADRYRGLLHAINADDSGSQALRLRQVIPAKGLTGAGISRGGADNSTTIHVHAADVEEGFRRAQLYADQRAATYTGRWR